MWLRVALTPLTPKGARRVLGRFSWALCPQSGACPFLASWWCHVMWGSTYISACPLKLVISVLHHLVMARRGWQPVLLRSLPQVGRGLIFVKVGLWGPAFGGRGFHRAVNVCTRHEVELECLVKGL